MVLRPSLPSGALIAVFVGLLVLAPVQAAMADTLHTRLGGQAVWDDEQDLTWVANANLAAGSPYDDGADPTDGKMTRANALAWADNLVFGGYGNWRLPTMPQQDPSRSIQDVLIGGVLVDYGGGGTLGEMEHMYGHLTGPFGSIVHTEHPVIYNVQVTTATPFYWSASPFGGLTSGNFTYTFGGGQASAHASTYDLWAWAVADGDVFGGNVVPLPTPLALVGIGLACCWAVARRRRRTS